MKKMEEREDETVLGENKEDNPDEQRSFCQFILLLLFSMVEKIPVLSAKLDRPSTPKISRMLGLLFKTNFPDHINNKIATSYLCRVPPQILCNVILDLKFSKNELNLFTPSADYFFRTTTEKVFASLGSSLPYYDRVTLPSGSDNFQQCCFKIFQWNSSSCLSFLLEKCAKLSLSAGCKLASSLAEFNPLHAVSVCKWAMERIVIESEKSSAQISFLKKVSIHSTRLGPQKKLILQIFSFNTGNLILLSLKDFNREFHHGWTPRNVVISIFQTCWMTFLRTGI